MDAKLNTLVGVIDSLFEGEGPDLLGLAEIETEGILDSLERRLRSRYLRLFEPGPDGWTGLSVLARSDRFADVDRIKAYRAWERSPQAFSAHIHSPLGGQGLNLGLGDAMNLGWKLVATLRGEAPEGLLDSYTAERHSIGARVLEWTRAQVALMRPSSSALAAVIRDLIATRDGATYFAERVWGVSLRYDLGEPHPLAGRSCPDFELAGGTKIGTLLREEKGLLLDFDRTLQALDGRWGDRVKYISGEVKNRLGLSALLVRPDGFVAWASDTPPQTEDVTRAAARWFG